MSIIEKLGIKPIRIIEVLNEENEPFLACHLIEGKKVEQQRNKMLESYINILQLIRGVEIGTLLPTVAIGMIEVIAEARQKEITGKTGNEIIEMAKEV